MEQIYVQSPIYDFSADAEYDKIREKAVEAIKEEYDEEQATWQEEMQDMVDDGIAADLDEAKTLRLAQLSPTDLDFTKTFEENIDHPTVQMQINDLANKFMTNYRDLPSHLVVDVPDDAVSKRGVDKSEALAAINARFASIGVTITDYKNSGKATEQDLKKQKAFESVSKMFESGDYQTFLKLRASIQKYSANNISMIYMQKPQAQVVMGFNAWKDLGRSVASGQKALAIWQPLKKTLKSEAAIDKYIQKQADTFPDVYKQGVDSPSLVKEREKLVKELEASTKRPKQVEIMDGMQLRNSVFDVSQTVPLDPTKDNIGDILKLNKPLDADVIGFDKIKAAIIEAGTILPIQIDSSKSSQADAIWDALVQYADKAFNTPEKINGIKSVEPMKDDMHKIETIMAAYMIAEHIGIDTADKAGLALAKVFDENQSRESLYMGRREMFMKGFDRSTKLSDMFVQDFDKAIGIDPEKTKNDIKAKLEAEATERQAKAEQLKQQAEADKDKYTNFGITKMLKVDEWQADGVTYTIGLSQKTNMYFAKAVDDSTKTALYATTGVDVPDKKKDPDGTKGIMKSVPIRFSEQPTRDSVEYCINEVKDGKAPDMGKIEFVSKDDKTADAPAPAKDDADDAVKQNIDDDAPLGSADDGMGMD